MAGGWQAQRAVDELGDITALDALRANAELVQLLLVSCASGPLKKSSE